MRRAATVLRHLAALPIVLAAYGWQDRARGLPGPRIALALPLRETGHQASVSLAALLAIWLLAFVAVGRIAPPRRHLAAAALRGAVTFAAVLAIQAASLQLIRQASLGFQWHAALLTASPWIASGCASAGTLLSCLPLAWSGARSRRHGLPGSITR